MSERDNSSMTIIEFLEARIAEDAAEANRAITERMRSTPKYADVILYRWPDTPNQSAMGPDRVLAECAAKRAIVEECEDILKHGGWEYTDAPDLADVVIRSLAAVYKDHPEYRQEWAGSPDGL